MITDENGISRGTATRSPLSRDLIYGAIIPEDVADVPRHTISPKGLADRLSPASLTEDMTFIEKMPVHSVSRMWAKLNDSEAYTLTESSASQNHL